jgi:hypothetical protein
MSAMEILKSRLKPKGDLTGRYRCKLRGTTEEQRTAIAVAAIDAGVSKCSVRKGWWEEDNTFVHVTGTTAAVTAVAAKVSALAKGEPAAPPPTGGGQADGGGLEWP